MSSSPFSVSSSSYYHRLSILKDRLLSLEELWIILNYHNPHSVGSSENPYEKRTRSISMFKYGFECKCIIKGDLKQLQRGLNLISRWRFPKKWGYPQKNHAFIAIGSSIKHPANLGYPHWNLHDPQWLLPSQPFWDTPMNGTLHIVGYKLVYKP